MDLDDFDEVETQQSTELEVSQAAPALQLIDKWYAERNRRGRRMDLIGDYAGSEPFVLDGESLLQNVLDDPLLAIGRANEPSYQILHAKHSLEHMLDQFISRSAVFDIVFFSETRHLTLKTGSPPFVVTSRALARRQLFNHLKNLDIPVYSFTNTKDEDWVNYRIQRKPMFFMTNDGGSPSKVILETEAILTQRVSIFGMLSQGIPVVLLRGAEFRDSKILSFVFEQGLIDDPRSRFHASFWSTCTKVLETMDSEESKTFGEPLHALKQASEKPDSADAFEVILEKGGSPAEVTWAFSAHCHLLPLLSAQERAQQHEPNHPQLQAMLLEDLLPRWFISLEKFLSGFDSQIDVDGNVFSALLRTLLSHPDVSLEEIVGPEVFSALRNVYPSAPSFSDLALRFPPPTSEVTPLAKPAILRLLPFEHEIFDDEMSSIRVKVEQSDADTPFGEMEFGKDTVFEDKHHWHNHNKLILPKHLGGDDPKPKDAFQKRKLLKRNQRFMARLGRDAGTLTGALGARFDRITITPVGSHPTGKGATTHPRIKAIQQQPTKKAKKESSKEKLLKEIKKQKGSTADDDNKRWWLQKLQELAKLGPEVRVGYLQDLERNPRTKTGWLSVEIRLRRLHYMFSDWVARATDQEDDSVRDEYTVTIMRLVKDIYESKDLTKTAYDVLSEILVVLGFESYIPKFSSTAEDHPLSFEFIKLIRSKSKKPAHKFMKITEDPVNWQLRLFGEFMDRSMDSQPDPRVAFQPDRWQREVLDCLDKNESVLVVAPTSAGKTFISFYAMEQTLRESDDGILVYVAPTKALVSQIAAEIYARFSKELKNGTCWAVHSRDYRVHDPQKCQILVTVPEMLSIMMLSPPLAKTWLPRMKRIIMDEIHTIGQQEGGAVWEQILLLAPCPIIGLSATIGEPEAFNGWLESVQKAHGFKHAFIHHPHRYSHLRKFYYMLQEGQKAEGKKFEGLKKYKSTQRMKFLHPITMLSFGARAMPPDLSLEARDTLLLYQALKSSPDAASPEDLQRLEPITFFASIKRLLRQADILRYESDLKEVVSKLISSQSLDGSASPLRTITEKLSDPQISKLTDLELNAPPNKALFRSQLIHLISDLHMQGDLPALLFNFDRTACEIMAYDLLEQLEEGEEHWRSSSVEWERKIRAYESWLAKAKDRERQNERMAKQKTDKEGAPQGAAESSWEASFDPDEPSPQFSFAGTSSYSKDDLDKEIDDLARWSTTDSRALKALKRGIGIHHAGMNKGYRSLVESLFRQGFLRVVIATGTLALGINAPTKTSVFCGDSPYLTALMYRQCAGRAGRRGYDLLGKVVFYGLAFDRVQRLVLSRLPSLGGNFPLTSTLVLRLLNLIEGSDSAPVAVNAVKSLLTLPQIVWGSKAGEHQFLHHMRFSIEYLRRARLLDYQGKPMNLFGIAAHLYYTEPSNLALVALLRAGVLHKICANPSIITAKQEFIILMSHLFGRRHLPRGYTTDENLKAIVLKSASKVVLPRLDPKARKVLLDHEGEILNTFQSYALTYAEQNTTSLGADDELPLSKIRYAGSSTSEPGTFRQLLQTKSTRVVARSVFVANSGHGDQFQSVSELARTTRAGLHLNEHAIPSMAGITAIPGEGEGEDVFELNAYIYDFYMHGQTVTLARDNGIRRGDVWYLLQDFQLSLMTIRGVVEQLLSRASQDTSVDGSEAGVETDSGYAGSTDPAERDTGDDDDESGASGFTRPVGVSDKDWRVYQVMNEALAEFDVKYRAMWA